ncbi:unnamed protein product [Periconia digitata]|uniref:methylated diphthine methylhydrolase n=1 Tax=Periconia digitata TaxID=1303443 RepID=A0A9W4URS8_9PLEO|nr:unnamed protein product [Periconia digitata]
MATVHSLQSLVLDLPPSCIEFWPLFPRYAVVGTYNLEKSSETEPANQDDAAVDTPESRHQERNGSVLLLEVDGDRVNIIHTVATPYAVLDIHFAPKGHSQFLFGVASSTGSVGLYRLTEPRSHAMPEIVHLHTINVAHPGTLVTAFIWHPKITISSEANLVACLSLTDGTIAMEEISPLSATADRNSQTVGSHDLEAWTVALTHDGMGLFSGGDDSVLGFWNLVRHTEQLCPGALGLGVAESVEWKDRKIHGAGVTSILPLKTADTESLIITGSYDDRIRLLHVSAMGRRRVLAEEDLGGGVWRLKQLNESDDVSPITQETCKPVLVLASCMHAGARILKLSHDGGEWHFEVLAKFEEHKSMNYGSDCQPSLDELDRRTFITTSFYDRLLCLWRF